MPRYILMDELHITIEAAQGLTAAEYRAIRRALVSRSFQTRLKESLRTVVRRYAALRQVRLKVSF